MHDPAIFASVRLDRKRSPVTNTLAYMIVSTVIVPDQFPIALIEMSGDKRSVDQMSVDQLSVDQMSVDQISVDQMSVDQMSVDQMSAYQMSSCCTPV